MWTVETRKDKIEVSTKSIGLRTSAKCCLVSMALYSAVLSAFHQSLPAHSSLFLPEVEDPPPLFMALIQLYKHKLSLLRRSQWRALDSPSSNTTARLLLLLFLLLCHGRITCICKIVPKVLLLSWRALWRFTKVVPKIRLLLAEARCIPPMLRCVLLLAKGFPEIEFVAFWADW